MNSTVDLVHDWLNENVHTYKVVALKEIEIDVERQTLSACYIYGNKVIDVVAWNHNTSLDVLVMTSADGNVENALVGTCGSKEQLIDRLIKGFQCAVQVY